MLVISVMLLTVWLGALAFDTPMGGSVHLLGITAILIVLLRKSPRDRALVLARRRALRQQGIPRPH